MSDREFYYYTPKQLGALRRSRLQAEEDTEFLFGQLTAAVVNFSDRRPNQSARPGDFMPCEMRKKARLANVEITDERREKIAKKLNRQLNRVFAAFEK